MKKFVIISTIISCVLLIINISLPLFWVNEPQTQIIISVISGWVSGIATLFVGILALLQSKKYNDANEAFVKKQYELEKSKSIIHSRMMFVESLKKARDVFLEKANPINAVSKIISVYNIKSDVEKNASIAQLIADATLTYKACYSNLVHTVNCDYRKSIAKDNLVKELKRFDKNFTSSFEKEENEKYLNDISALQDKFLKHLSTEFGNLMKELNNYVSDCNLDIQNTIANKGDDNAYLLEVYSPKKKAKQIENKE